MTEIVGQLLNLEYSKKTIRSAGTQTAALAFGGSIPPVQEQQKNMMEQVGQLILLV
jgi:hypothetical protein